MANITLITKVTTRCNFDCPYCYTRSTLKNGKKMELNLFKKMIFKAVLEYDHISLIFHGGEPLLMGIEWYKEACEYINYLKKTFNKKIDLGMQSNLSLLNEEYIELIKKYKIGLGFSYDGLNNKKTRKNDELIINNYYKLKKNNIESGSILIITKENYKNLINEVKYFNALKLKTKFNIVFDTQTMSGDLKNYNIEDFTNEYIKFLDYVLGEEKTTVDTMFYEFSTIITEINSGLCTLSDCRKKWIAIHPNGDLYPCGQEWKQKSEEFYFGNIENINYKTAFDSENYTKFYNLIEEKRNKCKNCIAYSYCSGGCPGEDFSNTGKINKHNKDHCYFTIKIYNYFKNLDLNKVKNKFFKSCLINGGKKC